MTPEMVERYSRHLIMPEVGMEGQLKLKQAKVLYVNSKTDKLFDIALCPAYVSDMRKAGVDITYVELPSDKGHMASHQDAEMWAPILKAFIEKL